MQSTILKANPDAPLRVYVVWSHHLPSDSRGAWDPDIINDPRVVEYWDDPGAAGRWFFDHRSEIGFDFSGGAAVWDSSLLYGPEATWTIAPTPLEHFGYTVISDAGGLQATLERIWAASA